jgi:NADPH2:quinone reductase
MRPGDAGVLKPVTLPDPTPGPDQLLVRVEAAGVNFIDTYRRSGVYRVPFPHVPGSEGAGTVVALGPEADPLGPAVGDRVAWAESVTGSYAELAVVDAAKALAIPAGMATADAAALALQGLTADYLVRSTFPVGPGMAVAFYAAAGGVGGLATQMVLASGARLLAVVGDAAKAAAVEALGANAEDTVVTGTMRDIGTELATRLLDLTGGDGLHAVYDSIGKDTFAASLRALRRRGTLILFGASSGPVPPFDPQELNAHGSLYLTRPTLRDYTTSRAELLERADRVFGAAAAGDLTVRIGERFPLAEAAAAHEALEGRRTLGKVLLIP